MAATPSIVGTSIFAPSAGSPCVETPEFVRMLKELCAARIAARDRTVIPGGAVDIDFASGTIRFGGQSFLFPPMGSVPQSLVVAGGVENLVARRLGL